MKKRAIPAGMLLTQAALSLALLMSEAHSEPYVALLLAQLGLTWVFLALLAGSFIYPTNNEVASKRLMWLLGVALAAPSIWNAAHWL